MRRFRQRLQETFPRSVEGITLFGSKARGTARRGSDVDLLVTLRQRASWQERQRVYRLTAEVLRDTGVDLAVLVLSRAKERRLAARGSPFVRSIRAEGKRIR